MHLPAAQRVDSVDRQANNPKGDNPMRRIQDPAISKGYRLKASTHKMIRKVQRILSCTQDSVIGRGVKMYYAEIKKTELKEINNKSKQSEGLSLTELPKFQ